MMTKAGQRAACFTPQSSEGAKVLCRSVQADTQATHTSPGLSAAGKNVTKLSRMSSQSISPCSPDEVTKQRTPLS